MTAAEYLRGMVGERVTKEQKVEAFAMRLDGCTFQEIGEHFGTSKQYIQQELAHTVSVGSEKKAKAWIYPRLRKWFLENNMKVYEFSELVGISTNSMRLKMTGKNEFNTSEVKKILEITGMTFEECFQEKEG